MTPNLQHPRRAPSRLTLWLGLAVSFWLALIAGALLLARNQFTPGAQAAAQPLPALRSSLHLPYFSFARALRPGS